MNVLIIHAHPERRSFTTALKDAAVEELTRRGHEVEVSDLYDMQFDPIAKAGDFSSRQDEITWCMLWSNAML
jgi:NAD(P)H dehydrogenase (quinone)